MQINQLDEEIRTIVRGQADAGHDGRQSLEEVGGGIRYEVVRCTGRGYPYLWRWSVG